MAVQRLSCLLITGALKTTPAEALDIISGLSPIYLHIKSMAAKGANRLHSNECYKITPYGHGSILQEV